MREKIKNISVLSIAVFSCVNAVYASVETVKKVDVSIFGIAFEILICAAILYFCIKGIRSCFKKDFYKSVFAVYHTEKIAADSYHDNKTTFDKESIKRVKHLMESRRRNEFKKNSTINQHLQKEREEKIAI